MRRRWSPASVRGFDLERARARISVAGANTTALEQACREYAANGRSDAGAQAVIRIASRLLPMPDLPHEWRAYFDRLARERKPGGYPARLLHAAARFVAETLRVEVARVA